MLPYSQESQRIQNRLCASREVRPSIEHREEMGIGRPDVRKRRPKTLLRIAIKCEIALSYVICDSVL